MHNAFNWLTLISCSRMNSAHPNILIEGRTGQRADWLGRHGIKVGLMTEEEKDLFLQSGDDENSGISFLPMVWAMDLVNQLNNEGAIPIARGVDVLCQEIRTFRGMIGDVWTYSYITVPLAYTQISTIVIYAYFVLSIFAWQSLDPTQNYLGHNIDLYIPIFGLLRLAFYMGWLKVAESLINPLGNDDDDFDVEDMLDRNVKFSLFWLESYQGEIPVLSEISTSLADIGESNSLAFLLCDSMSCKRQISSKCGDPFWDSLAKIEFTTKPSPG